MIELKKKWEHTITQYIYFLTCNKVQINSHFSLHKYNGPTIYSCVLYFIVLLGLDIKHYLKNSSFKIDAYRIIVKVCTIVF